MVDTIPPACTPSYPPSDVHALYLITKLLQGLTEKQAEAITCYTGLNEDQVLMFEALRGWARAK